MGLSEEIPRLGVLREHLMKEVDVSYILKKGLDLSSQIEGGHPVRKK